ncbi:rhomboid family intramembrane serine protease [Haloarculaceae archaeon H-GB1-1]|nr:rhomboid family intramembrane serine protease [Haloarculaceae archaeon H-GB1-1]
MAAASFHGYVIGHARRVWRDLAMARSPVTLLTCGVLVVVFAVQLLEAMRLGTTVQSLTGYLFYARPRFAWPLAFFLHRDAAHVGGNLLLIAFLGRLAEPNFSTRSYAAFFVGVAITSVSGGFLAIALFDRGPVVAYGASGLGFALAGYSLQYLRGIDRPVLRGGATSSLSSAEWLAVIVGLAAVFTVALDVGTGPFFDAYWLNGAHAVGLVVGLLVGWYAPPSRHPSV